jgi:hypothetical protein
MSPSNLSPNEKSPTSWTIPKNAHHGPEERALVTDARTWYSALCRVCLKPSDCDSVQQLRVLGLSLILAPWWWGGRGTWDRLRTAEWAEWMRCGRKRRGRNRKQNIYVLSLIQYTRLDSNTAVGNTSEHETKSSTAYCKVLKFSAVQSSGKFCTVP